MTTVTVAQRVSREGRRVGVIFTMGLFFFSILVFDSFGQLLYSDFNSGISPIRLVNIQKHKFLIISLNIALGSITNHPLLFI